MLVTLAKLSDCAHDFVAALPQTAGLRAHVVGLRGDLGAGKTTFVQHIARELGIRDAVTSPTYVIAERYAMMHPPFNSLVHIDAYRLTEKDVPTIGWTEFLAEPTNLIIVEWPEKLGTAFPKDAQIIELTVIDESTRSMHA